MIEHICPIDKKHCNRGGCNSTDYYCYALEHKPKPPILTPEESPVMFVMWKKRNVWANGIDYD